jgi:hypothetical protein
MGVDVDLLFMSRTFRIKFFENVGSCFYAQIGGSNFIITAKHLVPNLSGGELIGIRIYNAWQPMEVEISTVCDRGGDIAVIKLRQNFGEALLEGQLDASIRIGQDVVYCGFPLGLENEALPDAPQWPVPLIKGAVMSGARVRNGFREYLFDTINNRGFSGGPIVKREVGGLKVVGVVSGYKFDAPLHIEQRNNDGLFVESLDYRVQPNSGFMIATPINSAIRAAKQLLGQNPD